MTEKFDEEEFKIFNENSEITRKEFEKLFERNEDESYKNLIIPARNGFSKMDLRNKKPEDYTIDEIVNLKTYRRIMREKIKEDG